MLSDVLKKYIFPIILLIASASAGYYLSVTGFESVKQMRQLERVPASKVGALLPGEANVTAKAKVYQETLSSFYTKTPSFYYRYTEEKKETDSDGKTRWNTVDSRTASVDFYLKDETGKALVNRSIAGIEWSIPQSYQQVKGSRRYTEWRLEPDDSVFVFAMAKLYENQIILSFPDTGQYSPIISKYSEAEERGDMGAMSIVQIWIGVSLLSLCIYFIAYLFKIHRLVAYLSILTLVLAIVLVDMGMNMMRADLKDGMQRYIQQSQAAERRVEYLLHRADISFYGWHDLHDLKDYRYINVDKLSKEKINEIRINLIMARRQLVNDMRSTPEKWLVGMWKITEPEAVPAPAKALRIVEKRIQDYKQSQLAGFWPGIFIVTGLIFTGLFTWLGIRKVKLKRYIENVPTSTTSGVVYGVSEIKGKLVLGENGNALTSPLTQSKCAWYYYLVQERRGSGKNSKWVTIKELTETTDFYCKDEDGCILVDAEKAEVISGNHKVKRSGSFRYTEKVLKLDDDLYIIGSAALKDYTNNNLVIGYSSKREPFIISSESEKKVMIEKARSGIFNLNIAFSSAILSVLLLFGMSGGFAPTDFLLSALMAPMFMLVVMMILHYNDIIFLKQRVERNNANIQVSLKKRYNLIPNIENIVKGYARHEALLLKSISDYRSEFERSIKDAAHMDELIKNQVRLKININSLREDYPELKSNELIEKMMDMLTSLENELMYMRRGYNDAVEVYNTRIKTVPDIMFTGMLGFNEKEYIPV